MLLLTVQIAHVYLPRTGLLALNTVRRELTSSTLPMLVGDDRAGLTAPSLASK